MDNNRIEELLDRIAREPHEWVDRDVTRDDTVMLANELIWLAGRSQLLRGLAAEITADVEDVPLDGPTVLGEWVRANVSYTQEVPGVEVFSGPFSTLRNRTGDCDDLVILWGSLCVSIGLFAYLVGVGKREGGEHWYEHAIGFAPDSAYGLYELTNDARYGGGGYNLDQPYLPPGNFLVYYDPATRQFVTLEADQAPQPRRGSWVPLALGALLVVSFLRR